MKLSVERNGTWRNFNWPCYAMTWRSHLWEWTVFGVTLGASQIRIWKGTPPDRSADISWLWKDR